MQTQCSFNFFIVAVIFLYMFITTFMFIFTTQVEASTSGMWQSLCGKKCIPVLIHTRCGFLIWKDFILVWWNIHNNDTNCMLILQFYNITCVGCAMWSWCNARYGHALSVTLSISCITYWMVDILPWYSHLRWYTIMMTPSRENAFLITGLWGEFHDVIGGSPHKGQVARRPDVSFVVSLGKMLKIQPSCLRFEAS